MPKKKEKTLEAKETREEKLSEDEKKKKEEKALKEGKLEKPLDEAVEEKIEEDIGKIVEAEGVIPEEEIKKEKKEGVAEEGEVAEKEKATKEEEKIPDSGVEITKPEEEEPILWKPKTEIGKLVATGTIASIDEILNSGKKIIEPEIIDKLVPNLKSDIILIGGRKGKGGGIQRIPVKITASMHRSGRRFTSNAFAIVGDEDGLIGIGKASAIESRSAINKAINKAKMNVIRIKRGCGSWECGCGGNHSIPYKTEGKSGSVRVILMPAPKGLGLVADDESKKLLRLAGIKDVWVNTYGNTRMRINLITAIFNALKKLYVYNR